ncbi:hypothetical protein FVB9288_02048 [Flavobacterium sp. CECT 9288]|uniref:hypothetical protein n=1 Tax=Flavobacterium sp. CECT 9288 TaxID=2845819 RepID=UPI001E56B065|nr:hypothetical protein [Flavobacterium sp. CECT 9288]CAH0336357.1 hypothetical protein FVB9288_02048 [Flavobacterium sp. CECT 9288]
MKKIVGFFILILVFLACKQNIKTEDVALLNGYWEVKKVVFDSIEDKEYRMNEVYDYFNIVKDKGIRKKVMPQLDGTFLVNDVEEKVAVRYEDDRVFIDYTTPYMKWSEEIIALTNEELVLLNKDKTEYHYKRATAINLMGDGKEIK